MINSNENERFSKYNGMEATKVTLTSVELNGLIMGQEINSCNVRSSTCEDLNS